MRTTQFLMVLFTFTSTLLSQTKANFRVSESFGRGRTIEPVSGGLAFKKGVVTNLSQLSLFRNGTEIPAQFTPLVRLEDGSYQWVLVDFTETVAANGIINYDVRKQAPTVTPAQTIQVTRSGSVITMNNGVLSLSIDTVNFKGIQSLSYNGSPMLNGNGGLSVVDVAHSNTPTVNGPVTKAAFVYSGHLRVTYRVEGNFYKDSCGGLGYSYLITMHAGSPRVTISVSVRNSINEFCGRHALVKSADALYQLAYDPVSTVVYDTFVVGKSPFGIGNEYMKVTSDTLKTSRAYLGGNGHGFFITEKMSGGMRPSFLGKTTLSGRTVDVRFMRGQADSVMPIEDEAQQTSTIILECFTGTLNESGLRDMVYRAKGKLMPLQDADEISAAGALSQGKFGTLKDEEAAYSKWGWSVVSKTERQDAPEPELEASIRMFGDTHEYESDLAGAFLLQWLRYGARGFFDNGEAAAGYIRDQHLWRTTGFVHDGFNTLPTLIKISSKRKIAATPALSWAYDYSKFDAARSVAMGDHLFALGLSDYFCLTGDPDSKDAMEDLGEHLKAKWNSMDTINPIDEGYYSRNWGRSFTAMVRIYEITRNSEWFKYVKTQAKKMARFKAHPNLFYAKGVYDADGNFTRFADLTETRMPDSLKNYMRTNRLQVMSVPTSSPRSIVYDSVAKVSWPVYDGAMNQLVTYVTVGMDAYLRLEYDEELADRLMGIGQYVNWIMMNRCRQVSYGWTRLDYPRKGMFTTGDYREWNSAHAECGSTYKTVAGSFPDHRSNPYSMRCTSIPALAYRYSGLPYLLNAGKDLWSRGSKDEQTYFTLPENEVYIFARIGGRPTSRGYRWWSDDYKLDFISNSNHLFYEAVRRTDTLPPEKITNLSVLRMAGSGLLFSWTAPAGAANYQLKIMKGKPIAEYPDFDYKNISDTTKVPWWYAPNVTGEPAAAAAGTPQSFVVSGDFPVNEVYYAAICSRDTANNISVLSNLVRIDNGIAVESKTESNLRGFTLNASPNPFNPAVSLKIWVPDNMDREVNMSILNVQGKVVYTVKGIAKRGFFETTWNGMNAEKRMSAFGLYFVRIKSGNLLRTERILLSK